MPLRSQKVIIPKGLVNPNETTIIEIPQKLQDRPAVVAKPKQRKSQIIVGDGEYIKPKKNSKGKKNEKVDKQLFLEVPYDDPKSRSRQQRNKQAAYSRSSMDDLGNRLRNPQPTHHPSLPFTKTNSTTQATDDHQETDYYAQNGLNIRMGKLFANITRNNNPLASSPTPTRTKTDSEYYTNVSTYVVDVFVVRFDCAICWCYLTSCRRILGCVCEESYSVIVNYFVYFWCICSFVKSFN